MAKLGNIYIEMSLDDKTFKASLNQAQVRTRTAVTKMQRSISNLKRHWLGVSAAIAAVVIPTKRMVDAFMVQEAAENKLAVAMKNYGDYTTKAHKTMLNFAAGLQKVTAYGDEVTIAMMANLKTYGMNTEELKKATEATMDLAAAKGIDLRTASELVGKAFVGETGTLSRYGIVLEKGIERSDKFAAVLELINERFGGTARAEMETYGGRLKRMSNYWGDIQEQIGKGLVMALESAVFALSPITETVKEIANNFQEVSKRADEAAKKIAKIEPPPQTTWNKFISFMDEWGKNIIRVFTFMGKNIANVFALLVGDAIETAKIIAKEFWTAGELIFNALTFNFDEAKKNWAALGQNAVDFKQAIDTNWTVALERMSRSWSDMIAQMLGLEIVTVKARASLEGLAGIVKDEITPDIQGATRALSGLGEAFSWTSQWERDLLSAGQAVRDSLKDQNQLIEEQIRNLAYLRDAGQLTWQQYADAVGKAANELPRLQKQVEKTNDVARDLGFTFSSAFEDAILEGQKLSGVLRALAQDVLRIFAREHLTKPLASGISNIISGLFHAGGIVGAPGTSRMVPAMAFAGAPKMHSGGLLADEIPIIARKGEGVLTEKQMQSMGGPTVQITNNNDFRGADPASEARIRAEIKRSEDRTMYQIDKSLRRGGPLAEAARIAVR